MLIVLLNIYGVVHYEFVPQKQILNQLYYFHALEHVWENIWWKWSVKWNLGGFSTMSVQLWAQFCCCMNFWLVANLLSFHTLSTQFHP